ncbi:putative alanine racemase [Rosellinia necatrix]|uniref:Putative transcription factor kapC n=1 Tax=Rosellinia necatrix TaxID=77044 RepID=A0A1S7UJW5_ROSNE|nr:putative alanine racemase [Rosellinia necatrix]
MPDPGGAENLKPNSSRPSFTGFWKHSKNKQASQNLTFVSSKLGQPPANDEDEAQAELSAEAKAKERRQQVRRAQRQHRQRKANYTKQLESDIAGLRDDIAKAEQEVENLRNKNDAIRAQLASSGGHAVPIAVDVSPAEMTDVDFSTFLVPNYTVSLDISEHLGTPAYHVRRTSPSLPGPSSKAASSQATEILGGSTPASTIGTSIEDVAMMEAMLSQEQTDLVINFILALEHCCWDHIDQSCFEHRDHHHQEQPEPEEEQPSKPGDCHKLTGNKAEDAIALEDDTTLNGHTLMATALVLQSAPADVFTRIADLQQHLAPAATPHSTTTPAPAAALVPAPAPVPAAAVEWPARALTLTNLRRLAGALNPSDAELAPVQAWFELAARYGTTIATDAAVLAGLRAALAPAMHCVVFGAAMHRPVFEAALERVIGFLSAAPWDGEIEIEIEGEGEGEGADGVAVAGNGKEAEERAEEGEGDEVEGVQYDGMAGVVGAGSYGVPRGVD